MKLEKEILKENDLTNIDEPHEFPVRQTWDTRT